MKCCKRCGKEKPLECFGLRLTSRDGRRYYCKTCDSAVSASSRAKHPERVCAYYAKRKAINPTGRWLGKALCRARSRAEKKGVPFAITSADVRPLLVERCPALGVRLVYEGDGYACPDSANLDRLRPELGYVPGNIVIISRRANMIKSDANAEQIAAVAKWLRST